MIFIQVVHADSPKSSDESESEEEIESEGRKKKVSIQSRKKSIGGSSVSSVPLCQSLLMSFPPTLNVRL